MVNEYCASIEPVGGKVYRSRTTSCVESAQERARQAFEGLGESRQIATVAIMSRPKGRKSWDVVETFVDMDENRELVAEGEREQMREQMLEDDAAWEARYDVEW